VSPFSPPCYRKVVQKISFDSLPADRGYIDLNRDMSVSSMPVTHGLTKTGSVYESAAYFLRNNATERELLFFGDVEPDSISSKPQTINVWKAAAPKIPHTLASIFIECSWTSDRPDNLLYGHLNPAHLVDELVVLALEVYKVKNNLQSASVVIGKGEVGLDTRARKKKKLNPISLESLRGVLDDVTVYIMHCKSDVGGKYDEPINQVIGAEVRALIEKKGLGVQVVVLEQGTRISECCHSTRFPGELKTFVLIVEI
jgi:cAMP phosphodiesterase